MTLDGTNTWVLLEPGLDRGRRHRPRPARRGPPRRRAAASSRSGRPGRRRRCSPTATRPRRGGAAVRRADRHAGSGRSGAATTTSRDGDVLTAGGLELRVVATPGHTSDSLSFALPADHALLTGDTVLGRGTTVVAHPDGELGGIPRSLERIAHLTGDGAVTAILPGHGPVVPDAAAMVAFYRTHRARAARAGAPGARRRRGVRRRTRSRAWCERVYADVPQRGVAGGPAVDPRPAGLPGALRRAVSGRGAGAARRRAAARRGPRAAASRGWRSRRAPC